MSRSVRKYKGLSHTQSGMKHQKRAKRDSIRVLRSRLKADFEGVAPIAKKCHSSHCYDGKVMNDLESAQYIATRRSNGYNPHRVIHKMFAK